MSEVLRSNYHIIRVLQNLSCELICFQLKTLNKELTMISAFKDILTAHILHNFDGHHVTILIIILLMFYQREVHCDQFSIKLMILNYVLTTLNLIQMCVTRTCSTTEFFIFLGSGGEDKFKNSISNTKR